MQADTHTFEYLLGKPLEASQLTASQADIPQVCVFACTQNTPNLRCCFLKRRLTNTTRRHRLADGQLSSLYPPSPSFSPFGAASVMLCCSPPPASSSTPLRPSVCYPCISVVVNIIYTRFPSGKRLGEWRKNETKSIQRETNTTTPEIEE